jgi:hypothetical protein
MASDDGKTSKSDAKYTPYGSKQEHCSKCRHFESPDSCEKVRGQIAGGGWCRFFYAK